MRARWILAAGALATLAGGCNFILGIEHDYEVGARHATGGAGGAGEAGGAGGDAASSSSSASSSSGGPVSCPDATMVSLGAFCIDATEVTNAAYAAWLATGPSTAAQPAFCGWNTDFTPSAAWPAPAAQANRPVAWVDWCDAFAYCAAAGKRLCGRVGGGPGDFGAGFDDPAHSEWMAACSNGGATAYPYGAGYAGDACDGKDYQHPNQVIAVGSAAVCHGVGAPYAAIFDLSGNVAEWEDACSGASGAADLCRRRGGSFKDDPGALRCGADDAASARADASATTGFRCCGG